MIGHHLSTGDDPQDVLQFALEWSDRCEPPIDANEVARAVADLSQKHVAEKAVEATGKKDGPKESQATVLIKLTDGLEMFHDVKGDAYATVSVNDHLETRPVRAKQFKQWLARRYWDRFKSAPSSQAFADALSVIEGKAVFDGDECRVHVRVADDEHDAQIRTQSKESNQKGFSF